MILKFLRKFFVPSKIRKREEEIAALEKLLVKACGGDMELTYIGNGLAERLKPFGIEGVLE